MLQVVAVSVEGLAKPSSSLENCWLHGEGHGHMRTEWGWLGLAKNRRVRGVREPPVLGKEFKGWCSQLLWQQGKGELPQLEVEEAQVGNWENIAPWDGGEALGRATREVGKVLEQLN